MMPDPLTLPAHALLAIPAAEPERLFSGDPMTARAEYLRLAGRWHPDRNPDRLAHQVFQRITQLYRLALEKLRNGDWRVPGRLALRNGGVPQELHYLRRHDFELGALYIAREAAAFVVVPEHADLLAAATRRFASFRFAGHGMQREASLYLPKLAGVCEAQDGRALVLEKAPDLVLLRDLLDRLGGRLPPRHVAWVLSSLLNIACYFQYAGLTHNAIGPDTYFVSPEGHSGALLGGWWYAQRWGRTMRVLPCRSAGLLPPDIAAAKRADPRLDLELIRATGRELLGDAGGARLRNDPDIPRPLVDWLRQPSAGSAIDDYELWHDVLKASFGARRFVELGITARDVYA